MREGRCLCGACTYQISGDPVVVAHCHCIDCQRGTGAGHSTGAMFSEDGFSAAGPTTTFTTKSESGNGVMRTFCATCGSPLFGRNTGMPGHVTVSAGTLLYSDDLAPQVAIFGRSRRAWDDVATDIPTFEAQPNWKPQDGV
jgi:hypothetical protein